MSSGQQQVYRRSYSGSATIEGSIEFQSGRKTMEDFSTVEFSSATLDKLQTEEGDAASIGLFAVFDGHGADWVSQSCKDNFFDIFLECAAAQPDCTQDEKLMREVLDKAYKKMDALVGRQLVESIHEAREARAARRTCFCARGIRSKRGDRGGSTSVTIIMTKYMVAVAHAGDSKAVVFQDGSPIYTSPDHRVMNSVERERIIRSKTCSVAGNYVRLDKKEMRLGVTRAFGDFYFKSENSKVPAEELPVTCVPEVYVLERRPSQVILLASDGFWDYVDMQEVYGTVYRDLFTEGKTPSDVVKRLKNLAHGEQQKRRSFDNISVVLLKVI